MKQIISFFINRFGKLTTGIIARIKTFLNGLTKGGEKK